MLLPHCLINLSKKELLKHSYMAMNSLCSIQIQKFLYRNARKCSGLQKSSINWFIEMSKISSLSFPTIVLLVFGIWG